MGFLKELFEKKLKTSGAYGEDGIEIGRSAQSDWNLPALRQQKTAEMSLTADDPLLSVENPVCYLQTQQSARSFSYASQLKQQVEHTERIQAAVSQQAQWQPTSRIKYDSINQFSQKVELYRGSVATVFKAVCIATNTKVIVKAYYKQKMHPKHFHKLHREIQSMKSLNGPYVAEFYATFEDSQCVYIIMEFCEGGDLFKTMLMHGGLLDEQWVCVEVITPLLRILEKMHSLKYLHRDIKPENIFLTSLGKFKLGDFGLAIKHDEEIPFSRSGTLDYMAPEVLKNPSVPFQEGKSVDLASLTNRGVKPYGPSVDVWAAGVLAYELVCGRPPFEVEDEAQTAALIMYSDAVKFPPNRTQQWVDFVKAALVKSPDQRPNATALLKHTWIITNLQNTLSEKHRPSKEMLLQPLPLDLMQSSNRDVKRTVSMTAATAKSRGRDNAEENAAPLPVGGVPSIIPPPLPAGFPATPTGAARQLQHLHVNSFGEKDSSNTGTSTGSGRTSVGPLRPSHLSIVSSNTSGVPSPASVVAAERLRDIQQVIGDGKKFETESTLARSPSSHRPPSLHTPASAVGAVGNGSSGLHSPSLPKSGSFSGGGLKPSLGALKITLPPETEFELSGASDAFCYSPTTPVPKPGIKERMKFYFQRQAGGASGL